MENLNTDRIEHLKKTIGHCVAVIALCEVGGQEKAKESYERRLVELNEELRVMLLQNQEDNK